MKNKIFIPVIIASLVIIFYAGYRLGVANNNRWTIEYMLDQEVFHIATRVAYSIDALDDIYSQNGIGDLNLACKIKKIIIRNEHDWERCLSSRICNEKISDGYYSEISKKISKIKTTNCD